MGYYTRFSISIDPRSEGTRKESLKDRLNEVPEDLKPYLEKGIEYFDEALPEEVGELVEEAIGWNPFVEECKWYSWEKEMKSVSSKYTGVIFVLEGEGEEPGDMWKAYFLNGKMQKCEAKITFDDFDPNKLS